MKYVTNSVVELLRTETRRGLQYSMAYGSSALRNNARVGVILKIM